MCSSSISTTHPTLTAIYCGGFLADSLSNLNESRVNAVEEVLRCYSIPLIRFNYTAHGAGPTRSGGEPQDMGFTQFVSDTIAVLGHFKPKNLLMIGSSIGAAIAPWVAIESRAIESARITGFFGVSPASPSKIAAFFTKPPLTNQPSSNKPDLVLGQPPSLDQPLEITRAQIVDILRYEALPEGGFGLPPAAVEILHPTFDPLSSAHHCSDLAHWWCKSPSVVTPVSSDHELSIPVMCEYLLSWLQRILTLEGRS